MALLSREQIFGLDDSGFEDVPVPEWGGTVRLRTLTGTERDAFEAASVKTTKGRNAPNLENFRARLISQCAVDEHGARLFTNAQDVKQLGMRSAAALQRLFNKCQEMNGLSDQDVDDLTEDFDSGQEDRSISG